LFVVRIVINTKNAGSVNVKCGDTYGPLCLKWLISVDVIACSHLILSLSSSRVTLVNAFE